MKKKNSDRTTQVKINPELFKIRKARLTDVDKLLEVEKACFSYDQLGRRNFQWMISKARSIFLVIQYESKMVGYGLVLMNKGTSLARLYSICTLSEFQGHGLATKLIAKLEEEASEECAFMRLEVKESNKGAIKLYEKLGYVKFTEKDDYYDDGETALCYEKQIRTLKKTPKLNIPYYQQGTDFTCGPSCLLMAMKTFNPKLEMNLSKELQIWREATTIFMTSGHGGCGPHGLALAAWRRGYKAHLFLSHSNVLFIDTVRNKEKKRIIELVHNDFEAKLKETNVKVFKKKLTLQDLKGALVKGGVPLVLITTYHFNNEHTPHWVVVTAYDESFVYIHDPDYEEEDEHTGVISRLHIPIPIDQFLKISRWGKDRLAAAVIIYEG